MKIGKIKNLYDLNDLKKEVSKEEYEKIENKLEEFMDLAKLDYPWQFFDALREGAKIYQEDEGLTDNDEYMSISDYLDESIQIEKEFQDSKEESQDEGEEI